MLTIPGVVRVVTIISKERAVHRPLSAAQLHIWFAQQLAPKSLLYNIGGYIEIHGAIDPTLLETALRRVVAEAKALHVTFVDDSEAPQQILDISVDWSFPVIESVWRRILARLPRLGCRQT